MAKIEAYREYVDIFKGRFPEKLLPSEDAFSEIIKDSRTFWAPIKDTEIDIPVIYPGEYMGVNNIFMSDRGFRSVGFASMSECVQFPENFHGFDAVLEVGFNNNQPLTGYSVDYLSQFDGEQSTVRYFKARVLPVEGADYVTTKSDVSIDDFEYMWNELYYPRFSELSQEFPVSGTLDKEYLWNLINQPGTITIITKDSGVITGFCVVCKLDDFESYDIDYADKNNPDTLKWYCPVIVGNQSASAANALKMAKIMGKNIRSFGGGILYFDCPNRTYPYIQKVVMAMREKDSPVVPECYARALFRVLIPELSRE